MANLLFVSCFLWHVDAAEEPAVYVPSAPLESDVYVPGAQTPAVQHLSQSQQPQIVHAQPMQTAPEPSKPSTAIVPAATPVSTGPVNMHGLGKDPKRITCPYCQQSAVTNTSDEIDACTIIAVVVLLLLFWPLFWIRECPNFQTPHVNWLLITHVLFFFSFSYHSPYTAFLGNCCKTTNHHCGHCHRKVRPTWLLCLLEVLI